jgi:RHS repeat-associated protein
MQSVPGLFYRTAADGSGLTGFDNFWARMTAGSQGRFLSPDPDNAGADPTNPQTWNMYSYTRNNPLKYIDPSGLCTQDADGNLSDDDGVPCTDNSGNVNLPGNSVTVTDTAPQVPFDSSGFGDQSFLGALFYSDSCGYACPGGSQTQQQTQQASLFPNFSFLQNVDWRKLGNTALSCTADHYGLTGVAAGIGALGIPIPKALVLGRTAALSGASSTMSLASAIEYGLFKGAGPRLAAPLLGTTRVLGVIGRAAPVVSAALFAYDAASIGYCVYQGSK